MPTLNHICEQCDSEFTIKYNEETTETDPSFCPFCGEMLVEYDVGDDDE
jgi:transcription initiation factor IIE alpha subunit